MDTTDRVVVLLMVLVAVAISVSLFEKANTRIEHLERDRVEVQRMYSVAVMDALVKSVEVYGCQTIGSQSNHINQAEEKAFELEVKP